MKNGKKKRRSDLIFVCVMLAFPLAQFMIMWVGVHANSILLAFKQYDIDLNFMWTLDNFRRVINDLLNVPGIRNTLWNGFILWFFTSVLTLPVSLLLAFYLYKRYKFHNILKTAYFIPSIIASVVTITVFFILCDRVYPFLVEKFTGESVLGLLINDKTQYGTVIFYNVFYALASNFLYMSSAMSSMDNGMSEAAMIDGASPLQEFWHVTLPSIYPMLSVFFIASLPSIFVGDFGLYALFKTSGTNVFATIGSYFTVGLMNRGEREYPYFAAFGIILSIISCFIVFSIKAVIDHMDPYRDESGIEAAKKHEKKKLKEERRNRHDK